jgi:Fur family transcriptional regulator, ferric uptake regulator
VDQALERLRRRGIKRTPQRVAVLRALGEGDRALSAADVFRRARRHCPELGLSTVYRTLWALTEAGMLDTIGHHDGEATYRLCSDRHHHHLVCSRCLRVEELPECDLSAVERDVASEHGYRVEGHSLSFHGVCGECQAVEARRSRGSRRPRGATRSAAAKTPVATSTTAPPAATSP